MPRKNRSSQTKKGRLQRVSIRAERRDEVDWDRYAWALLQHAKIVSEAQTPNKPKRKRKP